MNVLGQCLHSSQLLVPSRIHTMTIDNKIPPIDAYNMCIHAWLHTKLTSNSSFRGTHTDRLLRLRHTWSLSFLRACIYILFIHNKLHNTCTCMYMYMYWLHKLAIRTKFNGSTHTGRPHGRRRVRQIWRSYCTRLPSLVCVYIEKIMLSLDVMRTCTYSPCNLDYQNHFCHREILRKFNHTSTSLNVKTRLRSHCWMLCSACKAAAQWICMRKSTMWSPFVL